MGEKRFHSLNFPALFGGSGPAEAEHFAALKPVSTREEAVSFLNQCNRSIVEPLDRTGESFGKKNYFFTDLKSAYPHLWPALNRIRTYRNNLMHAQLNALAQQHLDATLEEDFDGDLPETTHDGWFRLQSAVLDGLLIGVQAELANYE